MGLDQFAKKVKREYNSETLTETIVKTEIAYWRKHNALEGYMSELYYAKTEDEECSIARSSLWTIRTWTTWSRSS